MSPGPGSHHSSCLWTWFQGRLDEFQALEIQEDLTGGLVVAWWPHVTAMATRHCHGHTSPPWPVWSCRHPTRWCGLWPCGAWQVCGAIAVSPEGKSTTNVCSEPSPQGTDWTCPVQRVALARADHGLVGHRAPLAGPGGRSRYAGLREPGKRPRCWPLRLRAVCPHRCLAFGKASVSEGP